MKIPLLLLFLACNSLLRAQDDYVKTEKESSPSARFTGNNLLALNLTVPATLLMGAGHFSPRFSLMYRRMLQPNRALRIWANYEILEDYSEDFNSAKTVPTGPNTFEYRAEYRDSYRIDLRVGMDWSKPDRAITAVYGADIFAGLERHDFGTRYTPYFLDTAMCANCWVPSPFEAAYSEAGELEYLLLGADFSIGCLFRPSAKTEITLQWTPELTSRSELNSFSDSATALRAIRNDGIGFNFRGIELFAGIHF